MSSMSFQDSQFTKLPACLLSVGCSSLPSSTDVAQLVPSNDSSSWWLTLKNTSRTNPKPFKVGKILYISEHVSRKRFKSLGFKYRRYINQFIQLLPWEASPFQPWFLEANPFHSNQTALPTATPTGQFFAVETPEARTNTTLRSSSATSFLMTWW